MSLLPNIHNLCEIGYATEQMEEESVHHTVTIYAHHSPTLRRQPFTEDKPIDNMNSETISRNNPFASIVSCGLCKATKEKCIKI